MYEKLFLKTIKNWICVRIGVFAARSAGASRVLSRRQLLLDGVEFVELWRGGTGETW